MNINDRLDQISAIIDQLRQQSADGRRSRELVDSLFRSVHTFKAAASAEGFTDLSRTAHEFENLLHALRTGKVRLDAEVLRAFDETVVALRSGSPSTINGFKGITDDTNDYELPAEFPKLKDEDRHRANAAVREGAKLYVMTVEFEVSDFDERFRQLKARLEEVAELISTSATMKDDKIIFEVVYASNSEKTPVRTVLQQAVGAGQATASSLGKKIHFVFSADDLLLEKSVSDVVTDALLHLVRNAIGHGIDVEGTITIAATRNQITVTDDGRGITADNLPRLFQPGFSTAPHVSEFSGRGVGLDAVKAAVEELGGSVSVSSEPGKGSSFKITLPDQITMPSPSLDA